MNGDGIFILLWGGHLLSNILFKDKTDEIIITTFEIYMTGPSLSLSLTYLDIIRFIALPTNISDVWTNQTKQNGTSVVSRREKKKTFSPKLLRCWIKGSRPSSNSWLHGKINQQNKFYELVCVCVPLKETRDDCLLFSSTIRDEKNKTPRIWKMDENVPVSYIFPHLYTL
jgi:hypothetical protein